LEQGHPVTGQILDRARNDLNGARDSRHKASIAATGFGLSALCIADHRRYQPHAQIVERVRATLDWHLNRLPQVHGFFFHFTDVETGARHSGSELSSIDTALLLCGILTARAYFKDAQIRRLATQIYERVDWPWMLNGGKTFSMGWHPESGFLAARWSRYCELMMIYLLAIGSPTHPVAPETWNSFTRPAVHYAGFDYISVLTRCLRISIRRHGTTFGTRAMPTPITLPTPLRPRALTRRSAFRTPNGTASSIGESPRRIMSMAMQFGADHPLLDRWTERLFPARLQAHCLSYRRSVWRFYARCARNGANKPGPLRVCGRLPSSRQLV